MRYFKRVDKDGKTLTVESYSHNAEIKDAIQIEQQEYDDFIAANCKPDDTQPEPLPTIEDRIAGLEARIAKLEGKGG